MRSRGYATGYHRGEETDFVRRITGQDFPRFHAYTHMEGSSFIVNLHLDQKKPSYAGSGHAHGGEYDGNLIEEEIKRIRGSMI